MQDRQPKRTEQENKLQIVITEELLAKGGEVEQQIQKLDEVTSNRSIREADKLFVDF